MHVYERKIYKYLIILNEHYFYFFITLFRNCFILKTYLHKRSI